jgi:hypothetical protein
MIYSDSQKFFLNGAALLDEPAGAATIQSAITLENCYRFASLPRKEHIGGYWEESGHLELCRNAQARALAIMRAETQGIE